MKKTKVNRLSSLGKTPVTPKNEASDLCDGLTEAAKSGNLTLPDHCLGSLDGQWITVSFQLRDSAGVTFDARTSSGAEYEVTMTCRRLPSQPPGTPSGTASAHTLSRHKEK